MIDRHDVAIGVKNRRGNVRVVGGLAGQGNVFKTLDGGVGQVTEKPVGDKRMFALLGDKLALEVLQRTDKLVGRMVSVDADA